MKGDNIAHRRRRFAVEVVRLCRGLSPDLATKHIMRQLLRAGTGGSLVTGEKADELIVEADELVAILTASIKTARLRAQTHGGESAGSCSSQ